MKYGLIYVVILLLLSGCIPNLTADSPPDRKIQAKTITLLESKSLDISTTPTTPANQKLEVESEVTTTTFVFPPTPIDCNPIGWWRGNLIYGDSNYDKTVLKMEFRDGFLGEMILSLIHI